MALIKSCLSTEGAIPTIMASGLYIGAGQQIKTLILANNGSIASDTPSGSTAGSATSGDITLSCVGQNYPTFSISSTLGSYEVYSSDGVKIGDIVPSTPFTVTATSPSFEFSVMIIPS